MTIFLRPSLFFVILCVALSSLFSQENNCNLHAPITTASLVELDPLPPGVPEEQTLGATTKTLFAPIFLGQESKFVVSVPAKCCVSNRSNHEYGNEYAFAGILENGSIYAWGDQAHGGQSPTLPLRQDGVPQKAKSITSNQLSFVATLEDDSLWEWGLVNTSFFKIILDGSSVGEDYPNSKKVDLPPGRKVGCCIASTAMAFAAILDDGSLYAWGFDPSAGKTPPLPKDEKGIPKKACSLYSNYGTFTAVFPDKTFLAWGNLQGGGENDAKTVSLPAEKKLQSCCALASTRDAFAAILEDGSLFVWGKSAVQLMAPSLPAGKKAVFITASNDDFTVLLEDENQNQSFLSWGTNFTKPTETKLPAGRKIQANCCIVATACAFATILDNGAIFAWGDASYGGSFSNQPKNRDGKIVEACCLAANDGAFSATLQDGSIITWGNYWYGGVCWYNHGNIFPGDEETDFYAYSTKACCLVTNHGAFSAILDDGSVLAWGSYQDGGNLTQEHWSGNMHYSNVRLYARSILPAHRANVTSLVSNGSAFAALTDTGSLIKWGNHSYGGGYDEEIPASNLPDKKKLCAIASPLKKETYYEQDELAGIAIIGNATPAEQGKWQFLLPDNNTWMTISNDLSETKALTLSSNVTIRFLPAPDFIGEVAPLNIKLLDVKAKIETGAFIDTTLEKYADSCTAGVVTLITKIENRPPPTED